MSLGVQAEEESQKDQVDESVQEDGWQRSGGWSGIRIREAEKHTTEIQQRAMEQDNPGAEEDRGHQTKATE